MKDNGETKGRSRLLAIAICVAFALEFAGCKGGGAATTEPAPGTAGTNSVATNAVTSADTNATTATTTK